MNPLNSVRGAIITGVILALIVSVAIPPTGFAELGLAVWIHILAGVMWIGLLYYFNVVQTPGHGRGGGRQGRTRAAPASTSTSPRARCCGSAGRRW